MTMWTNVEWTKATENERLVFLEQARPPFGFSDAYWHQLSTVQVFTSIRSWLGAAERLSGRAYAVDFPKARALSWALPSGPIGVVPLCVAMVLPSESSQWPTTGLSYERTRQLIKTYNGRRKLIQLASAGPSTSIPLDRPWCDTEDDVALPWE